MAATHTFRRRFRATLAALAGISAILYFGYHGVRGERGVGGWFEVSKEIAQFEQRSRVNAARIEILERRVFLLRNDSLDLDMLEERARAVLGLVHPNELVILGE